MVSSFLGWDPHSIKAAIHRKGKTLTDVALGAGLTPNACSKALSRHHYRGEQAIIAFLEVSGRDLWPGRYDKDGIPFHPVTRQMHLSDGDTERLRSKESAA